MVAKKPAVKDTTPAKAEESKDWTYLVDKEPSELHNALAEYISEESGLEVDPKAVQAVLAMHGSFQRSERNKARAEYRPRTQEAIYKTGAKTAERFEPEPEKPAPKKPVRAARKPSQPRTKTPAAASA
jgi:hypothetical protein